MQILRYLIAGVLMAAFAVVIMPSFFRIDTTEYAIVTQFGRPVRAITEPGLAVKLPAPIQTVIRLDKRIQVHQMEQIEFLTRDKKNILVEAYATWQVSDALQFFKSVGDTAGADIRLADILASELGVALGQHELSHLVTTDESRMQLLAMLAQVTQHIDQRTIPYGFRVTDVRLKRLNFPQANRASVFRRMRAERARIARQLRSEGAEEATKIRATATADQITILSKARREAERIRGEGEAEAIRIYAKSFGQNPEFYQFLRSLQAYDKVFTNDTTLILPADSALLKYLHDMGQNGVPVANGQGKGDERQR
ncbi:protease modulator HflC [Candidatus Entotheonella palauensis]|uniref:protease modulator HflC n=1 Tax=Candidatus Entotheonella palauensis TaxID=93172 RepID=UPI000B7FFD3D|nr:protease modulator HflC [Candidatus Entotheonella palauensis]